MAETSHAAHSPSGRNGPSIPVPILIACALTFVLYLGAYMRLPLVPLFAGELGASTFQVGMINAGFMLAATFLSLPLGLVSDRLGRRRLILAGMAISALTSLFLLFARTPFQVGAIYLFSGVGLACFSPAMMSYVGDVSPTPFLGRAYGWYTSALYLGMAAGPGLGGVIGGGGFMYAFSVSAAIIAAGVLLGGPKMPAPPPVLVPPTRDLAADFREIANNRAVLACWLATFFSTYAWGSLFAFFPLYARDSGIPVVHTGFIFTCQAAANALFRIPIGHFSDRLGKRVPFIVGGNLLFSLAIGAVGQATRLVPLYFIFLVVGGSMAATFTAIGALISEAVPTRIRGLAMGGYNTCIYGGFAVSAATLGAVISRSGFSAGFALAGGMCAAATLVLAFLFPRGTVTRY
ncbi:MAG: MFS transporter [Deltaproteobacteria bacterium]|nr:MFS transporter [Deltaproteobacteria bacterium]